MSRRIQSDEDWDDEDADWGDADDDDDQDEGDTIPCPHCRRHIHEDSPRCPYCEHYISDEDVPATQKPWWIVLGAGLCLYVVYRWIAG